MIEFLTLNQMHIEPPNQGLTVWRGFAVILVLGFFLYDLAGFIQWIIDRYFTVTDWDYGKDAETTGTSNWTLDEYAEEV